MILDRSPLKKGESREKAAKIAGTNSSYVSQCEEAGGRDIPNCSSRRVKSGEILAQRCRRVQVPSVPRMRRSGRHSDSRSGKSYPRKRGSEKDRLAKAPDPETAKDAVGGSPVRLHRLREGRPRSLYDGILTTKRNGRSRRTIRGARGGRFPITHGRSCQRLGRPGRNRDTCRGLGSGHEPKRSCESYF